MGDCTHLNSIFAPIAVDIDNLGWDCFLEGQIPQSLMIAIKPMYIRYNPRGLVDIWGSRLIKSLIGLTHKQWLFWNSDVRYISKGLTVHQHNELTARIHELMKTKHKILLPRHRHFIQIDFNQLGRGPTLACQVWVASMEMAISIAKVARGIFLHSQISQFTLYTTDCTHHSNFATPAINESLLYG